MDDEDMKLIESTRTDEHGNEEADRLIDRISRDLESLRERLPLLPADFMADASFPFGWSNEDGKGGERPSDPLTIYFWLSSEDDSENYTWKTSLAKMISDFIELHTLRDGTIEAENFEKILRPIAEALISQAQKLMAYAKPIKE